MTNEELFSGVELDVIENAGHPGALDFDEIGLARRVLELPDTGSDHWYAASAVTLAAAYIRLRATLPSRDDVQER